MTAGNQPSKPDVIDLSDDTVIAMEDPSKPALFPEQMHQTDLKPSDNAQAFSLENVFGAQAFECAACTTHDHCPA